MNIWFSFFFFLFFQQNIDGHCPKSLWTAPSNVLPLHFKPTFPPLVWIFTEDEGDGIESMLAIFLNPIYLTQYTWFLPQTSQEENEFTTTT